MIEMKFTCALGYAWLWLKTTAPVHMPPKRKGVVAEAHAKRLGVVQGLCFAATI